MSEESGVVSIGGDYVFLGGGEDGRGECNEVGR
jgi:hypothetical protein